MAETIDTTGAVLNLVFRRGEQFTRTLTLKDVLGDTLTNISSATFGVFNGPLYRPTVAVSGITITPTVTDNTSISFTFTSTQTRVFEVNEEYCYVLEVTFDDGTIESSVQGSITAETEIA
jgi:hypothetical protein